MKKLFLTCSLLFTISSTLLAQSWYWVKATTDHNVSSAGDPFGIALDNAGYVYQTGTLYGGVTFGSFLVNSIADDTYLAKYDSNGNVLWINTANNVVG